MPTNTNILFCLLHEIVRVCECMLRVCVCVCVHIPVLSVYVYMRRGVRIAVSIPHSRAMPDMWFHVLQDLVIWGHEHECLIHPRPGPEGKSFHVVQPGSTVATSLIPAEVL